MGDTLYIGSCSGSFYALDRHDGSLIWSHDTAADGGAANFHSNVAITKDRLVVGTDGVNGGHLYAFDPATGDVLWRQSSAGGFPSDVTILGGRVYAVTLHGEVCCIDLESGKTIWATGGTEGEDELQADLMVVDGRVLVGLPSGTITAYDADSGKTIWQVSHEAKLNTSLERIDRALYVGDVEGGIHRHDAGDGRALDSYLAGSPVYGNLTVAGECLLSLWAWTTLACLDPGLEAVRWSQEAASWTTFQPLVRDGVLVAGTESGEVRAMDLASGETIWSIELEGQIKSVEMTGDLLYVGTLQGRVYAVRLPQGEPKRTWSGG